MSVFTPQQLYTAAQSRAVDRCAIEVHGLPGPLLMARAARAAFAILEDRMPNLEQVQILCGAGNNGGDGLLLAMLCGAKGIDTRVFLVDGEPRSADGRAAFTRALSAGVRIEDFASDTALFDGGVVVDAMLGTGLRAAPRPAFAGAIAAINRVAAAVLALDVPSGVDSDTGHVPTEAVRADYTVSFITAKRGLYTGTGAAHAGSVFCVDLDVPTAAYGAAGGAVASMIDFAQEREPLQKRPVHAHKGDYGRCLLVGGDVGMGGAILLAARAALCLGVGLARVATRGQHLAPLLAHSPECMAQAVEHRNALVPLLDWADAIVIGPGLGREPWGEQMLQAALGSGKPLLVDADAINLLADGSKALPEGSVITPHPGEAARLIGCTTSQVQADRFAAVGKLEALTGAAVVLKGNGSLVSAQGCPAICLAGNPGMASGGMGDVLSGVIGALLAQGALPASAARLGAVMHAMAGDRAAAEHGECALRASHLFPELEALLR